MTSPPAGVVTILAGEDGDVIARTEVPGSPHDVAFTPDAKKLWVSFAGVVQIGQQRMKNEP